MRKLLITAMLLSAGAAPALAPAPAPDRVRPGQTAVTRPDGHGIVTMLRPVVTRLAVGDDFRIALHWAAADGPLKRGQVPSPVLRVQTLGSFVFHLTPPGGKPIELKLA